ncbi:MAG TPA: GNAT family N-acetyltransferase [Tepidisphaeraceae bacterium]|nr:GNAT family N-acetyltransferase [Tepidisphaeraceae bacterium]
MSAIRIPADGNSAPAEPTRAQADELVHWIGLSPSATSEEWPYNAWRECVLNDPEAAAYVYPDVVLADPRAMVQPPLVYVHRSPVEQPECFSSLAVLAAKTIPVQTLPGLPYLLSLRGHRVLEDRLVGDNTPEALNAFTQSLAELVRSGASDCVLFQDLDSESPLRQAILQLRDRQDVTVWCPSEPVAHWWIRFPEPADQYWQQFSKKTRYNFRYRAKRLEHTVTCIREPAQVSEFLEKAESLSRHTWQYHRLKMAVQAGSEDRQFWERIAALGAMRSYLMEQNGRPLAYAVGLQWKDCFHFEKTGYDPAYAAHSPGNTLLYRMIEDLIARDTPRLFDFGYGHSEYKEIFANYQTTSGPIALVRRGVRPSTVVAINRMHRWLGRNSRALLRQIGVLRLLRRLYRR